MKKTIIIIGLLFLGICANAQNRDSLIYTLRNIDWPLTVFKGQFRGSLSAELHLAKTGFDEYGDVFKLADRGYTYSDTPIRLNLAYGILDIIQLRASIDRYNVVQRMEPIYIQYEEFSGQTRSQSVSEVREYKGLDDLTLAIDLRWPAEITHFDVRISSGIVLPLGPSGFQEPVIKSSVDNFGTQELQYNYRIDPGMAALGLNLGAAFKYRFDNSAISISGDYRMPLQEGSNKLWTNNFDGSDYNFYSREFSEMAPWILQSEVSYEYQFTPFFNGFIGISYRYSAGGWTEPFMRKVATRDQNFSRLNVGADLIVSTSFWYRQSISLPLTGESAVTPFIISSLFTFNKF